MTVAGIILPVAVGLVVNLRHQRGTTHNGRTFSILEGQRDGHPVVLLIDMGLRRYDRKSEFPYFLSVETKLANPTGEG